MTDSLMRYGLLAFTVIACTGDPTITALRPGSAAQAAKASSSGGVLESITMGPLATETSPPGDIAPLTTPDGGVATASVSARAPFKNLRLENVSITLNSATGDVDACKEAGSTRTYSASFGNNAGTWTGELDVWQGRSVALSSFKFTGTRTLNGLAEIVQFTANDDDAVQTTLADGSTVLRFDDVHMGFGSQSTHYDVVDGLPVLRCLRVEFTAAR
jgi:hypothetical protein